MSLGAFLAAGNTLPGGFMEGGSTDRGGFANVVIDTPRDAGSTSTAVPSAPVRQHYSKAAYNDVAQYAGTGKAPPFMGAETTKLYLSFVNDMVDQEQEDLENEKIEPLYQRPTRMGMPLAPAPAAAAAPPPGPPPKWEINDELMHQKWGSVLRTLQPNAVANQSTAPLLPRSKVSHAPAYVGGKSYQPPPASRLGVQPSVPRWGNQPLSARPSLV